MAVQTEVGMMRGFCIVTHSLTNSIGLLIGACINRAPAGTFGAAVAEVGVMDLLRVNRVTSRFNEIQTNDMHPSSINLPLASFIMLNSILTPTDQFVGKAWTSDYGDPDDPNDFDFIQPLSPLHNVPSNAFLPPTLLLTADRELAQSFSDPGTDREM